MFGKRQLMREGTAAEALVLDKKIYASTVQTNTVTACGYQLRVQFEDGSTSEIFRRVMHREGCRAVVGELIPVRFDPADRSKIEVDIAELKARDEAEAARYKADAIARGEAELRGAAQPSAGGVSSDFPQRAAAFREQSEGFRESTEAFRESTEAFAAMARAKAAGNQGEAERLKAEFLRRTAESHEAPGKEEAVGASRGQAPDSLERLKTLADLHDRGVLTDAEFATEKAKILGA